MLLTQRNSEVAVDWGPDSAGLATAAEAGREGIQVMMKVVAWRQAKTETASGSRGNDQNRA